MITLGPVAVFASSCAEAVSWYCSDDTQMTTGVIFFFFFWQLLLNSDESGPSFILENWLRERFSVFYWLHKYPVRGVSALPLPPLSVFLPLFFLCLTSNYPFFLFETFLCFVFFLLSFFIQKGKKTKAKSKREDNNFSTFFFFLHFSFPSFLSSVRRRKEGRM